MLQQRLLQTPRARTLVHPGPLSPNRIQSMQAQSGRHVRLWLQPGFSLFDGLIAPLMELGINSASTTILCCGFSILKYCVAPPDPNNKVVTIYSAPIDAGAAMMIFGNATIGKNASNHPIVHCHAAVRTEGGIIKGGHILPEQSFVGELGGVVLVTSLDEFELRVTHDPETNIPLLQPTPKNRHG